jgi:E3 ubiquitin-protein ligase HUWE1
MMQTSGVTDGLRNLIDSSLPKSVKSVMENPRVFGPQIFALCEFSFQHSLYDCATDAGKKAINIMTTFVHNEPTSLAIIQEGGLPEAFYNAICEGVDASIDVSQDNYHCSKKPN